MPISCGACEPGYFVRQDCTNRENTVCQLCPKDQFQPNLGFAKKCKR